MRILQVIQFFTPKGGGSVDVVFNLSKELALKGHDVTIITTDYEYDIDYVNNIRKFGVNVITFPLVINLHVFLYSPSMKKWVNRNISHYDIIHVHNFRTYQNCLVCHAAKKQNIPYIIQPHNDLPRLVGKKNLKIIFDFFWGRKILKNSTQLVAVSNEENNFMKFLGINPNKINLIYNGLDLSLYYTLPSERKFKTKFGIDKKIILYIGRIHKSKGIYNVVLAFFELLHDFENIILVIAGPDDGFKSELEILTQSLQITDKIVFTGFLSGEDKISAYVDAEVFIHTVLYMGGVGLTPLEAILCETPVIVTPECGEIIKKFDAGYIVQYGDIAAMKEKMEYILKNHQEAKNLTKRGKQILIDNFSWNVVINSYEQMYNNINKNQLLNTKNK